jgi:hypothetical protein
MGGTRAMIIYELHLTADWKPYFVRTQKWPGTEAPGQSLFPTPGATPEEDCLVTTDSNIS